MFKIFVIYPSIIHPDQKYFIQNLHLWKFYFVLNKLKSLVFVRFRNQLCISVRMQIFILMGIQNQDLEKIKENLRSYYQNVELILSLKSRNYL